MASKKRIERIMAAVKAELKAQKLFLSPEILQKLEEALSCRWYDITVTTDAGWASYLLTMENGSSVFDGSKTMVYDSMIDTYVYGEVKPGQDGTYSSWQGDDWEYYEDDYVEPTFDSDKPFIILKKERSYAIRDRQPSGYSFVHRIVIYIPEKIACVSA